MKKVLATKNHIEKEFVDMFRIFVTLIVSFLVVYITSCDNEIVLKLNSIILTEDDLPMWQVNSIPGIESEAERLPVIAAFEQGWYRHHRYQLAIQYWLLDSSDAAQKAGAHPWTWWTISAVPKFQSESNPEDIIGDATWYYIQSKPRVLVYFWFVKIMS